MTDTATKPLPNGTTNAPADAKIIVRPWKGERPKRVKLGGRGRIPSPYDAVIAKVKDTRELTLIETTATGDALKPIVSALRKAAKFFDVGLDIWPVEEGIVFGCRAKRAVAGTPEVSEGE